MVPHAHQKKKGDFTSSNSYRGEASDERGEEWGHMGSKKNSYLTSEWPWSQNSKKPTIIWKAYRDFWRGRRNKGVDMLKKRGLMLLKNAGCHLKEEERPFSTAVTGKKLKYF